MSKTSKIGINWTISAIALALLCAVLSFSVMAQDNSNKPLDAEAASALRQELIDGLPDLIDDEAAVEKITEKWVARRDLAGKTREEILETLYYDTESLISDPELRDSIWKAWTAEADTDEQKTDEAEPVKTPQKPVSPVVTPIVKAPEKPAVVVETAATKPANYKECRPFYLALKDKAGFLLGVVQFYNAQKGFGFIIFDEKSQVNDDYIKLGFKDGEQFYFDGRDMEREGDSVKKGDKVGFAPCGGGKPRAGKIMKQDG